MKKNTNSITSFPCSLIGSAKTNPPNEPKRMMIVQIFRVIFSPRIVGNARLANFKPMKIGSFPVFYMSRLNLLLEKNGSTVFNI